MSIVASANARDAVQLFKIVTVKDEIVVGVADGDLEDAGKADASAIGRALASKGELTLWQFAVRKGKEGELEQAPLRRISILGNDSLRVEPYSTPLRVVPPTE